MANFATIVLQKMLLDSPSDEHFDVKLIVESGDKGGMTTGAGSPSGKAGSTCGPAGASGSNSNGEGTNSNETVLRAHRIVLSTVSDVFRKMFLTSLREHNEGIIRIPDFTPGAVAEALTLIYGGELSDSKRDWQLAGQVWDFGHRFKIPHVIQLARCAALDQISKENSLRMLGFSLYINDTEAVTRIRDFISDETNFGVIVQSSEFTMASYEVISNIHRPPAGSYLEDEVITFEKVWNSDREAQRNDRLTKAMRLIDFNRMKTHELRECRINKVAGQSPALAVCLVGVLLARCEKLESGVLEKERELDDISGAYQLALRGKQDAERSARISDERFQKASSGGGGGGRMSRDDIGKNGSTNNNMNNMTSRHSTGRNIGNNNSGSRLTSPTRSLQDVIPDNHYMQEINRANSASIGYTSSRRRGSGATAPVS